MLTLIIAFIYVSLMIWLANVEQANKTQPILQLMKYGFIILLTIWVANAIAFVIIPPENIQDAQVRTQFERVDLATAIVFIGVTTCAIIALISMTHSTKTFTWLDEAIFARFHEVRFRITSPVHQLAVMLMILQSIGILWTLLVSGGLAGLDFTYNNSWEALGTLASSALIYLSVAILGVGWGIRRNRIEVIHRLKLRLPTRQDWLYGVGMALLLYVMLIIATTIWSNIVSADVLEEQTIASQQLFEAFNSSIFLGLILAITTGISEEILFRGALQPVFGNIVTSVFFTVLHIQYALTPATLILFFISLGFGWLHQRVSTTASIIAHATYNFIPFLLFALLTSTGSTS